MACFAVRSDDLISPRSELRRDGMIPGLVHTFCPMVFSSLLSDEKPKNGGHFFFFIDCCHHYNAIPEESAVGKRRMYNGCSRSPTFAGTIQGGASGAADRVGSKEWLQPFGLCCTGFKKNEVSLTPSSIRLSTQLWRRPGNSVGRYLGGTLGALHMCCPA